jgi:uncharacterized protein (TIGR02466 family)
MKNVLSLFSAPVAVTNIDRDLTKDELQIFLKDISMYGALQSGENSQSKDLYLFDNKWGEGLKNLKMFFEEQIKKYLEEIEGVDTDRAGLRITQAWLNKTNLTEQHSPHTHVNSYLSGVFFISCLPNDCINLIRPTTLASYGAVNLTFPNKKVTAWNPKVVGVDIKEGDLIIFPSWIPHFVNVNETNKERISLAFNTFPIGEMGEYRGSHLIL